MYDQLKEKRENGTNSDGGSVPRKWIWPECERVNTVATLHEDRRIV